MFRKGQIIEMCSKYDEDDWVDVTVVTPGKKRTHIELDGGCYIWAKNSRLRIKRKEKLGLI